jgi:hypothetical protein
MRQFGVEVGATRQREIGLSLPRSAWSDARRRAAGPSSQLPRDDLNPTTRRSMLLTDPAALRVEPILVPGVRRLAAADTRTPTDIHTRASVCSPYGAG